MHTHYRRIALAALAMALALAAAAWPQRARADWRSITGALPEFTGGVEFEISPDARYVAYVADINADDVAELYIASLAGGAPRRLSPSISTKRLFLPVVRQ